MGKYEGRSQLALHPKSTEQVSQIMKHCNQRRLAVVPQVKLTYLLHVRPHRATVRLGMWRKALLTPSAITSAGV